ncbi:uncharacterized protein LOC127726778 isoform X1 [Mytilus californianus]|uniref:uncharacterized protein LOC127726778 isoform X1 n=1 Tax=Mytilus californianus TaxID=6549 RepID=UPI002247903A|nr:uncharacterized protein LOC127726778 isoform X1 [Mytilus californianus]
MFAGRSVLTKFLSRCVNAASLNVGKLESHLKFSSSAKKMFRYSELSSSAVETDSQSKFQLSSVKSNTQTKVWRQLGNLETLFYKDLKFIQGMFMLSCKNTVDVNQIRSAFEILTSSHPLMRMSVQERDTVLYFVEVENMSTEIRIENNNDYEAVMGDEYTSLQSASTRRLWMFTWLKPLQNTEDNTFRFIFSINHCIADFQYYYLILVDFLEIMKDLQNGSDAVQQRSKFTYHPPIEQILTYPEDRRIIGNNSTKTFNNITSLQAYENYFKQEIAHLAKAKRIFAASCRRKLDLETSHRFISKCKTESVSVTSAMLAASVISFCKLLRMKGCRDTVTVQLVFAVDLRKYINNSVEFYAGMAVVLCPVVVDMDVSLVESVGDGFWKFSRCVKGQVSDTIKNRKPLDILYGDIETYVKNGRKRGKSDCVITLSNIENVGLELEQNDNFQLIDFQMISDIRIDYCPIFMMLTHVFNGILHLGVAYESSYTSSETVERFTDEIQKVLIKSIH